MRTGMQADGGECDESGEFSPTLACLCGSQLVGGSANVSILLPLLEKLCSEEETTVRDAVSGGARCETSDE